MKALSMALILLASSVGFAGPLADRAQRVADTLSQVGRQMDRTDRRAIRQHLDEIELILRNYGGGGTAPVPADELMCIKDTDWSDGVNYRPINIKTRVKYGTEKLTLSVCQKIIAAANHNFVCGKYTDWRDGENYRVTLTQSNKRLGTENMMLDECVQVTQHSRRGLICLKFSDWRDGENFGIYDLNTKSRIGSQNVTLNECVNSI